MRERDALLAGRGRAFLLALAVVVLPTGRVGAEETPADASGAAAPSVESTSPAAAAKPVAESSQRELETRAVALKEVSEKLVCQCGCSMILAECSHQSCPFALPARKEIAASIAAGESDSAIIAAYVLENGKDVLAIPPTDGSIFRRFAWFAPFLALGVGFVVVATYLRRITRPRTTAPPSPVPTVDATPAATAGDDERRERYRRQIEQELGGPAGGPLREPR